MLSQVKETATTATGQVANATATVVEKAIGMVEQYDADSAERPKQYGGVEGEKQVIIDADKPVDVAKEEMKAEGNVDSNAKMEHGLRRLKMVTGDLLDLWLYEGSKGLKYVQESKAYKATDPYVNYIEKYESVRAKSEKIAGKIGELNQRVVLFYDDATNFVGMLIKVLQERQDDLIKYIRQTYSNVQVFVSENWMRLNFNQDGTVSMDDMRKNLNQFYDFLKNYDYIEATIRIKSNMYDKATQLMKKDQQSNQVTDPQAKPQTDQNAEEDSDEQRDLAVQVAQEVYNKRVEKESAEEFVGDSNSNSLSGSDKQYGQK